MFVLYFCSTIHLQYYKQYHANNSFIEANFMQDWQDSGFGGLVVSMLDSGTQVRGFKPDRSRRIFRAEKILRKAVCPTSQLCGM
jgi:hypothetical protein